MMASKHGARAQSTMRDTSSTSGGSVLESLLAWGPECSPTNGNMSLPVSSYEELLARVRSLTHETIQLQRELTTPLAATPGPHATVQLDQNLNDCRVSPSEVSVSCDKYDNARGGETNGTWATSPPHPPHQTSNPGRGHPLFGRGVDPRRPTNFQRPLSFHGNGSKSMSWKTSSTRRTYENDDFGDPRTLLMLLGKQPTKQKENSMEPKEEDEKRTEMKKEAMSPDEDAAGNETTTGPTGNGSKENGSQQNVSALYHGTWPVERNLWNSCGPASSGSSTSKSLHQEAGSVMSFSSGGGGSPTTLLPTARRAYSQNQLTSKVDMVYSLLSMLGTQENREDMTKTLLAMSSTAESCQTMRQSGCLPLLVELLHVGDGNGASRHRAAEALRNVVHAHSEHSEKRGRREVRVLRLLEQLREYCDSLRDSLAANANANTNADSAAEADTARSALLADRPAILAESDKQPGPTIAALMKLSFDEEHRHAMCQLGGLHAIAELIELEHEAHGSASADQHCVTLRRYAGMALTNLTFGDGTNKALLCSFRDFMRALVAQLGSPSEDLRQVTASVLRNLSWRADGASKQTLREVGAVTGLMWAAIDGKKESTLKSILSALWNLSAHCSLNKVDICAVDGALGFLIGMLSYQAPSKTLAIVENAGGILRNISSHIAIREDYRCVLRDHNCLHVLLQQLKSPSLTVVSNACGTLWNLSARCPEDQKALWEMGAVNMLRSLVHSKHKMISMGSSAALKNLLGAKPPPTPDNGALPGSASKPPGLPSLYVRKQRALEQELDESLAETCDNIEPSTSPPPQQQQRRTLDDASATERSDAERRRRGLRSRCRAPSGRPSDARVCRSDSRDSVTSSASDTVFERASRAEAAHGATPAAVAAADGKFVRRYSSAGAAGSTLAQREERRRVLSLEIGGEGAAPDLGSPYSRLGHSDDAYAEKSRECRRVRERVKESLSASSSEPGPPAKQTFDNPKAPYAKRCSFARAAFADLDGDDDDGDGGAQEHPVDYSLKYVEPAKEAAAAGAEEAEPYGDYAETDLDQPTDYSLKYPEEDDDARPDKVAGAAAAGTEGAQAAVPSFYRAALPADEDTLQTYCTEGTPYETPYNFSTATSMSDLRLVPDDKKPAEKTEDVEEAGKETAVATAAAESAEPSASPTPLKLVRSGVSSGLMSPDKPMAFYEEGTPGSFSRVSSLSSLHSAASAAAAADSPATPASRAADHKPGSKVVTFGSTDHFAEETPLMFSRCSSLGSLSSMEQHSIHDDRSSVVSDLSRRTSGAVSPSELPDSPTQTTPPRPRTPAAPSAAAAAAAPAPTPNKASVFEDDLAAFKEEDTPVEFSRGTSLSSLTIDDDVPPPPPPPPTQEKSARREAKGPRGVQQRRDRDREDDEEGTEKQDVEKEKREGGEFFELAPVSEGDEDDDDMLAACINVGMQNRRRKYDRPTPPPPPAPAPAARRARQARDNGAKSTAVDAAGCCEDALRWYATEGTPAGASNAGSRSDLSVLSFACDREETCQRTDEAEGGGGGERRELSDDSSNFSGDNDNILAECIQSGMPKARSRRLLSPLGGEADPVATAAAGTDGPAGGEQPRGAVYDGARLAARSVGPRQREVTPGRLPIEGCESAKGANGLSAKDELENYATEGSPRTFSTRSSLSDLTVSTEGAAAAASCLRRSGRSRPQSEGTSCDTPFRFSTEDTPLDISHAASLSSLSCGEGESEDPGHGNAWDTPDRSPLPLPLPRPANKASSVSVSDDVVTVLSRNGSLSSLSVDSFGSTDPSPSEQALLEQCINSGMPKSKTLRRAVVAAAAAGGGLEERMGELSLLERGSDVSKNGGTTSGATPLSDCTAPGGVKSFSAAGRGSNHRAVERPSLTDQANHRQFEQTNTTVLTNHRQVEQTNVMDPTNRRGDEETKATTQTDREVEETEVKDRTNHREAEETKVVKLTSRCDLVGRQLTDDAEHRAAGACQTHTSPRASEQNSPEGAMANAERSDWLMKQSTEKNTWDDDVSPNDISFPSISSAPALPSNLESCSEVLRSMTDSKRIQDEAEKLTAVFRIEGRHTDEMELSINSLNSLNSLDIDGIKQPSMMDSLISLTASVSETAENHERKCGSLSLNIQRGRQSIKSALVRRARRPMAAAVNSIECMLENVSMTSATSQIDNVMPPSAMDDLLDLADMENSMISVASITSEVADAPKEAAPGRGVCGVGSGGGGEVSEIDNVAPPSCLDDLTDLTMEPATETLCSDTELADDPALTHTIDELPSDCSGRNTPLGSELSSAESTPRKRQKHRLLTPRQKRQLGKERYRTYTISAEEERQLALIRGETREENADPQGVRATPAQPTARPTPKQRRLDDRSRFETRVLDRTYSVKSEAKTSGIPKPGAKKVGRSGREKQEGAADPTADEMEGLLLRDAELVISRLNATRHHSESDDMMLDCETISLVSVDSESEQNSRNKSGPRPEERSEEKEEVVVASAAVAAAVAADQQEAERDALGPRIMKPGASRTPPAPATDPAEEAKGIRGRRKPLFTPSGAARSAVGRVRPTAPTTPAGPVRPTRASALRSAARPVPPPARPGKAEPMPTPEDGDARARFRPPERQGTFTKEESGVQRGSLPVSPSKTRIPVPASAAAAVASPAEAKKDGGKAFKTPLCLSSKAKPGLEVSRLLPARPPASLAKTHSLDDGCRSTPTPTPNGKPAAKPAKAAVSTVRHRGVAFRAGTVAQGIRSSVSNQSLRSQLSVSNSSINSIGSVGLASKTTGKLPKKEITSKIASLWKRVEEIQVQNRFPKKDTRVWITAESKADERKKAAAAATRQKLVRSSTFDGVTPKTSHAKASSASVKKTVEPKSAKSAAAKANEVVDKGANSAAANHQTEVEDMDSESADVVSRRKKPSKSEATDVDEATQRMSRLGSFFRIEAQEGEDGKPGKGPASAIVPPYNYSPPLRTGVASHIPAPVKASARTPGSERDPTDDHQLSTASKKVTSV